MKYEMIFGDEKLFDGAPEYSVIAIKRPFISGVRSEKMYFFSSAHDAIVEAGSSFNFNNVILKTSEYAERHIIKEPKRWTWEDKKAGRLPEVGTECNHCNSTAVKSVISVTDEYIGIKSGDRDNNPYFITHAEFLMYYIPIETPADKAQREEDEFVASITMRPTDGYSSDYIEGLRAAYRKLKGGE